MASIYDDDEKKRRAEAEQAIKRLSSDTTSSLGQTMSARMQDTTPSVVQSPIQQVMSMPMSTGSNWYSGKVPTQSEVLARIYQIGQQNYEQGRKAYDLFQQQKMDPSSPLYSPYDSPTNKAIFELQKLGYNIPSTGVTREWLEANRGLLANARFTTTGDSPAAPTTKSSKEQNAAYWYYQLLKDEDTTEAAENEWKALQDEVTYWAKRADRNMTDEEILAKIDWTKYKTLGRMDDALYTSVATSLNRGVEYSKDNLLGVIWAARNGSTGSATMDTVSSRLGRGNGYVENADIRQYLDPMSPNYNPYLVGSAGDNMDKAALYFGVDHFDKDWLENNRQYLASNDATAQKLYQQVYTAEQTTQAAEEELKKLNEEIEAALQFCSDPDQILDIIDFDDYKTLSKMRESLQSGKTMDTTRAIDFDYNEIVKKINDECSKVNSTRQTPDVVDDIAADYGSTAPTLDGDKAVQAGKDNAINAAGPVIKDYGTPEEQKVIKNAYTFKFNEYVRKLDALHKDGKLTADTAYNTILKATSNYSASKYVPNARVVKDYEARQKELEENAKQIDVMEARLSAENLPSLSPELAQAYTDKLEKLKQRNNVLENLIERDASKYKKASAELAKVNQAYDNAQQIADMNGLQPEQTVDQHKQMMDMIVEFGQRNINNVPAYTIYDYALQSGEKTQEELYPIAESKLAEAQDNLDTVNKLLDWINTNKVEVDSATMQNIRLVRDQMETSIKDSQYFLLRNSKDFSSKVEEFKQQVSEYWKDQNWFSKTWGGWTGYEYSDAAIAVIDPALFMDGSHANSILYMDDVEKDTYMYLYATEGKEAAEEYMAYMTDSSYGKLNTRVTERMTEFAMDMFGGDIDTDPEAIDATLASIIMAPMQITGFLYGVKQLVTGREINPNDTAYVWNNIVSNFRGQSKEQFLAAANGNKAAEFFIGLGYDAVTSGADSLVNNTLTGGILGGKEAIEALGAAGNVISALPMGLQATGGTMQDLAMRGASAGQIALLSGITAAAETLTESIHIGGIEDAKTPKTIKERLSQGFVKALQLDDAVGEALNEAIEGMSDDFIMGEYSQRETRINELIESGMDAEHAELQAYAEFGQDILMAALTGAVSSNISEGVTSFVSRRITPTSVNNTQETQDSTQNSTENQEQNAAINNQTQATETLTPEEMSQEEN